MTMDLHAEATTQPETSAPLSAAMDRSNLEDARSSWELDIVNDLEHGRWEAILNEDTVAELTYRLVGRRIVLVSTWVAHPYRQQRVATELISHVLDEIRGTGKTITIICPIVGEFIALNPKYADLIDGIHPGSGAHPHTQEFAKNDE